MLAAALAVSAQSSPFGEVSFANSGAPAAQADFLRGLALLHDFEFPSAAKAFRQAETADPNFAMAYWGEAMSYNHPLWAQQDAPAARAALSRLAPTPEERLAKAKTQREKDYLHAVEILYGRELAKLKGAELESFFKEKEQDYRESFANPYRAARTGFIEDVIEPRNTRFRIIRALESLAGKRESNPPRKIGLVPL